MHVHQKCASGTRRLLFCGRLFFSFEGTMATCVLYIDEAGNPDPHSVPVKNGQTPLFTLAGLALPLTQWRTTDREFYSLKKRFYSDRLSQYADRPEECEIKGGDLAKPSNKKSKRGHAFLSQVLSFIGQHGGAGFCATFLKNSNSPTDPHSIYTLGLQFMVERFSLYIAEHPVFSEGILILDSRMKGVKGSDIKVARSHMSYMFGNETGKRFINISEAPLFADSRLTAGLQLADIIASTLYTNQYQYYLKDIDGAINYDHMTKYWPTIRTFEFKSRQTIDGYNKFGYKIMDLRKPTPEH